MRLAARAHDSTAGRRLGALAAGREVAVACLVRRRRRRRRWRSRCSADRQPTVAMPQLPTSVRPETPRRGARRAACRRERPERSTRRRYGPDRRGLSSRDATPRQPVAPRRVDGSPFGLASLDGAGTRLLRRDADQESPGSRRIPRRAPETRAPGRTPAARRGAPRRGRRPPRRPTSSSRPTASANALWALGPPKGTSSSGAARPASTSPWVTAPIETSTTIGSPSLDGIAIASGFVPVSGAPPSGWASRGGEVAVRTATRPASLRAVAPSSRARRSGSSRSATTTRAAVGGLVRSRRRRSPASVR